ncbi:MAG: glycosyl hydrolase 53 family protein [Pirellulales bacterium]
MVNQLACLAGAAPGPAAGDERPAMPFVGVDANYSLGLEREGRLWRWEDGAEDLFNGMAQAGVRGFRVRLWTGDDGPHGLAVATEVVRRSAAAGLDPYLVLFLSEDWADLMKQPAPAAWADLDIPARAEAVRAYSRDAVAELRRAGLTSHLYEIGNEIDYGICGVYPGKSTKKSPESLRRRLWPQAAELIRGSQAGVLEADPDARFMLHVAHWWDEAFVIAFCDCMQEHGVRIDVVGLSYFPSANIGGSLEMADFFRVVAAVHAAIGRPIVVAETAYPSTREFTGQFGRWKRAAPGYPLTPDGQRRWLTDFLDACGHDPAIAAVYYWSPEWYGEGMWKAFALFDVEGAARPAWSAFAPQRDGRSRPKRPCYLEARGTRLHTVPLAEASTAAAAALGERLETFGGVNVEFIASITAANISTGAYRVRLRAALNGNLDLELTDTASGLADWQAAVAALEPATDRLVLFARDPDEPFVAQVSAAAHDRGVEAVVHPLGADEPLRFGLGMKLMAGSAGTADATE